jgi:hypothetical protein
LTRAGSRTMVGPKVLTRAGGILGLVAVATALVGCGSSKTDSTLSAPTTSATTKCRPVGPGATKILASGLNRGKRFAGIVYAVPSGLKKTPWIFAARIRGAGVAERATSLKPTTPARPSRPHFIQAANSVAWHASLWGSLGSFPKNYPTTTGGLVPSLDDPVLAQAAACLG